MNVETFIRKNESITKTADYTIGDGISMVFCDTTSADIAITLPTISEEDDHKDRVIEMVKIDSSANKITCDSQEATTQYKSLRFQSNGTNWIPLL